MSIRRTPTEAEVEPCLDFTPVPRIHDRYDGWTPERQRGFIAALVRLGTVKAAAAAVSMSPEGAYYLRRARGAESFARAWSRAHLTGVANLRDIAYERAVEGTPRGVWHNGERVGEERRYNDRLLMFMLRREHPATYGALPPLGRGTKHPDTLAREVEWAGDTIDDPGEAQLTANREACLQLLEMYAVRARDLVRARRAGDVAGADFILRQLVMFEIAFSVTGDTGWDLGERVFAAIGKGIAAAAPDSAPAAAPDSAAAPGAAPPAGAARPGIIAKVRDAAFASAGPPPLPGEGQWWPAHLESTLRCGPTLTARGRA